MSKISSKKLKKYYDSILTQNILTYKLDEEDLKLFYFEIIKYTNELNNTTTNTKIHDEILLNDKCKIECLKFTIKPLERNIFIFYLYSDWVIDFIKKRKNHILLDYLFRYVKFVIIEESPPINNNKIIANNNEQITEQNDEQKNLENDEQIYYYQQLDLLLKKISNYN